MLIPSAALDLARQRHRRAHEACPHWDFEDDGDAGEPCCIELQAAIHARAAARERLDRQNAGNPNA